MQSIVYWDPKVLACVAPSHLAPTQPHRHGNGGLCWT